MAKEKLPKFTVQIEQSIVVSLEISAENIADAAVTALEIANTEWLIGPKSKATTLEYENESKVVAVLS